MPRKKIQGLVLRSLKAQGHKIAGRAARYVKVMKNDGSIMLVGPDGSLVEGKPVDNTPYLSPPVIDESTKQGQIIKLITRREGATMPELIKATGWKEESIRGSMASEIPEKIGPGVKIVSVAGPEGRVWYANIPAQVRAMLRFSDQPTS